MSQIVKAFFERAREGEPLLVHHKITDHLATKAMVYVRQSSLKQGWHHQESPRWPYALVERARSWGGIRSR